jgi:hypothetical protein
MILTLVSATNINLFLPRPDGQLYSIPKARYQVAVSLWISTTSLLEAHAWNM